MPTPNLFIPPDAAQLEPPTDMLPPPAAPPRRTRHVALGAALAGLLLVAGTAVALLLPGGDRGEAGGTDTLIGVDELAAGTALPAVDGPDATAPDAGAAPSGRPRDGVRQGLGDDTLLVGRLVANNGGTLVVAQDGGPERTVRTDGRTGVPGRQSITDLQPGQRVLIRVDGTGDAALAVTVASPRARALGTVTAVAGDSVTLVRADGRTETVNMSKVDRKPVVGDLVVLVGAHTDGAGFTADRIRVLPKAS